jgi:oligogalacturonide lyase
VILEQQGWLGHPQYRPFDDHTVAYCHEGPHDLVDARMWFIDEDGSNRRCGKEHRAGESCTHEFWVPDGSAMIYVSYRKGETERWIRSLDPVTLAGQSADQDAAVLAPDEQPRRHADRRRRLRRAGGRGRWLRPMRC